MPELSIRLASLADFEPFAKLCRQSYVDHYRYLWSGENLERYLQYAYPDGLLRSFLSEPEYLVWMAYLDQIAAGYLVFCKDSCLKDYPGAASQIKRIYLLASATGQGIGKALMKTAEAESVRLESAYIWLDVMQSSEHAIAFYQKLGYTIAGETSFDLIAMKNKELKKMFWMMKKHNHG